tara:strand:+ start:675 stop:854 length:180 start_codon:yes stop_codon:yes gene_type:complete
MKILGKHYDGKGTLMGCMNRGGKNTNMKLMRTGAIRAKKKICAGTECLMRYGKGYVINN